MKRFLALLLAVLMVVCLFAGCAAKEAPAEEKTEEKVEEKTEEKKETEVVDELNVDEVEASKSFKLGVAFCTLGEDYWEAIKVGILKAADELGVEVDIQSAQNDATTQMQQIENFITQKVDAVLCSACDVESIMMSVKKCNEAGIPFMFFSRILENTDDAQYQYGVGYDIENLAEVTMQWLADYAKANDTKLKVLQLQGALTDSHAVYCKEGVEKIAAENPDNIELVQVSGEWLLETGLTATTNALQANPDIDAIIYDSDFYTPSVVSALQQTGHWAKIGEEGHVMLAPLGGTAETLKYMEDGYVDILGVFPIVDLGVQSIKSTVAYLNGDKLEGDYFLQSVYAVEPDQLADYHDSIFGYVC